MRFPLSLRVLPVLLFLAASPAWAQEIVSPPDTSAVGASTDLDCADIDDVSLESLLDVQVSAASRYEQTAREAPAAVTVVTHEDIVRYGFNTLTDVFESIPGLYVTHDREQAYLGVRGFSRPGDYNNRVLILRNGHPVNETLSGLAGFDHYFGMELEHIERVEVLLGPGSALHGAGAMLAVVNIVSRDVAHDEGVRVLGESGTDARYSLGASVGGRVAERYNARLSVSGASNGGADLYYAELNRTDAQDGLIEGRDWQRYLGATLHLDGERAKLISGASVWRKGLPLGQGTTRIGGDNWRQSDHAFLDYSTTRVLGSSAALDLNVRYDYWTIGGKSEYVPNQEWPFAEIRDLGRSHTVGGAAQLRWDLSALHRFMAGADVRAARATFEIDAGDVGLFEDSYRRHVAGAYLQHEYRPLRWLTLTGGLRGDLFVFERTLGAVSPRVGVVVYPYQQSALKLLMGRAFRAPSSFEVNSQDPAIGLVLNPELGPELIDTAELIWEQELRRDLRFSASLYAYEAEDLIDIVRLPLLGLMQYQNVGAVVGRGAEVALKLQRERTRAYLSYSRAHVRRSGGPDPGAAISNSPEHLVRAGAHRAISRMWQVGVRGRYDSARRTLFGTEVPGSMVVDLTVGSRLPLWGGLGVSVDVQNVFDARFSHPASYRYRVTAIPQDGRSASVRLSYRR